MFSALIYETADLLFHYTIRAGIAPSSYNSRYNRLILLLARLTHSHNYQIARSNSMFFLATCCIIASAINSCPFSLG